MRQDFKSQEKNLLVFQMR